MKTKHGLAFELLPTTCQNVLKLDKFFKAL